MPAWTTEDEKLLLLTIIDLLHINKLPAWQDVAQQMGKGYSNEACRQHFQKIRRPQGASSSTPRKNRVAKTPTGTPSTKNKSPSKRKLDQQQQQEDDDEEMAIQPPDVGDQSPTKRVKAEESAVRRPNFKSEGRNSSGYVNLTGVDDEEEGEGKYVDSCALSKR